MTAVVAFFGLIFVRSWEKVCRGADVVYLLSALELPDSPDTRLLRDFKAGESVDLFVRFVPVIFYCCRYVVAVVGVFARMCDAVLKKTEKIWCCSFS